MMFESIPFTHVSTLLPPGFVVQMRGRVFDEIEAYALPTETSPLISRA